MAIRVTYINGRGFIFNVDDYMKIRTEYRIIGNLIGFNAIHPDNPNLKGLPATYNKFELQLLYDNKWIVLVSKPGLCKPASVDQTHSYEQFRINNFQQQYNVQRKKKIKERRIHLDKILQAKKNVSLQDVSAANASTLNPEQVLADDVARTFSFSEKNELIQVPTEHFLDVEESVINLMPDATIKYKIFKDLWQKGKFITCGESFGGDFLVYPGDPMCFHASHIIHIVESKKIPFTLLAAQGRLSVVVNKFCVWAYVNECEEICYQTVEWEGNLDSRKIQHNLPSTSTS